MSWWRLLAFFCALLVPVSANVFAAALWGMLANSAASPALTAGGSTATLALSAIAFFLALGWLFRERHRILDHRALFSPEPVEPRPVLVTGLSDLRPEQFDTARDLLEQVRRERVAMADLAVPAPEMTKRFDAAVVRLPWLQNIRAIWSLRARIERVVVVPSAQSQDQFALFKALVGLLIENQADTARPDHPQGFGARDVTIMAIGRDVDFGDYNAIQRALTEALRQARAPRAIDSGGPAASLRRRWRRAKRISGYSESDITVDVTPGTKQFSIVAAIASFGPEGRFLYVDNNGTPRGYNISLRLAGGLSGA